jgi:hypothetical protein
MGYRKTADGHYKLWCVGFDRKDDGGLRVISAHGYTNFADTYYKGDWVWDFSGR